MEKTEKKPSAPSDLLRALRSRSTSRSEILRILDSLPAAAFVKIRTILPDQPLYKWPTLKGSDEPLELIRFENYRIELELLLIKIRRKIFSSADVHELGAHLPANSEILDLASFLLRTRESLSPRIVDLLMRDLVRRVRFATKEIALVVKTLRRMHASHFSIYAAGVPKLDRDLYVRALVSLDLVQGDENIRSIKNQIFSVAESLVPIYPLMELLERFQPDQPLLARGFLDIQSARLGDEAWEKTHLKFPRRQSAPGGNSASRVQDEYEIIEPHQTLEDVVLPELQKQHLRALCRYHREGSASGKRLVFLFKGEPGTGKSMTSLAMAHELGRPLLKINLRGAKVRDAANILTLYAERARAGRLILLVEECEDLISSNPFIGTSDAWAKLLFESFEGVAIFTTNYEVPYGFERRVTYTIDFKTPNAKVRERILKQEIEKLAVADALDETPPPFVIRELAERTAVSGGYYQQILQLAASRSASGKLETEALREAFRYAESTMPSQKTDDVRDPTISLSQVQLSDEVARRMRNFVEYALERREHGGRQDPLLPRGATALFAGPSGTGKTIAAEAVAHELGRQFRRTSPSTFLGPYVGQTEARIRRVFQEAQQEDYVLFIDEAEGLFLDRGGANRSWERTLVDELLQQVEAFSGILIIATNHTEMMDAAFARRFLFRVNFDMPSRTVRRKIWQSWLQILPSSIDCEKLSEFELTGGEIRNLAMQIRIEKIHSESEIHEICRMIERSRTGHFARRIGL